MSNCTTDISQNTKRSKNSKTCNWKHEIVELKTKHMQHVTVMQFLLRVKLQSDAKEVPNGWQYSWRGLSIVLTT
eukprot:19929-Amphidinium_carterae.1